jgi:hypothetical protein
MSDTGLLGIEDAIASEKADEALDRKFWAEVARMWPRNWWSPLAHWRDFWLRHYARAKLHQLHRRAGAGR